LEERSIGTIIRDFGIYKLRKIDTSERPTNDLGLQLVATLGPELRLKVEDYARARKDNGLTNESVVDEKMKPLHRRLELPHIIGRTECLE